MFQERIEHREKEPQTRRVLYLTKDSDLILQQLADKRIRPPQPDELMDHISTDEIIPSRAGMQFSDPENLGNYLLTGLRGGPIKPGDIKGKFDVIVAGNSFGRGSSREHAQLALKGAGIEVVIAKSFERIFKENCHNYGIHNLPLTNPIAQEFLAGKTVSDEQLIADLAPITKEIVARGGILPFTRARLEGKIELPEIKTQARPMTMAEKIIARNAKQGLGLGQVGLVNFVKPGDQVFVRIDSAYAYELQTIIAQEVLEKEFPTNPPVHPQRFILFEDHLALMEDHPIAARHRTSQRQFAQKYGISTYAIKEEGVEGICHTVMLEKHVRPGNLVLGNDSHTCTLGAANALAVAKGASDFAAALLTEDVLLTVPETIRFNLAGRLREGVTSKDLMLYILSLPQIRGELLGSHRVFEFGGEALDYIPFDDQTVLTNMAVEGQGFTGIIEPNEELLKFLVRQHNLPREFIERLFVKSDPEAEYAHTFDIDLGSLEPMIALPSDPQNAIALSQLEDKPKIDFAYIGSCTGGKLKDLQEVAEILKGKKVATTTKLRIQASSQSVAREAERQGLFDIFKEAGAEVVKPGCGDCMGATKDAFEEKVQTVISDTNRNFPGRMGKGKKVYLANPQVVAASSVLGRIATPQEFD